MKLPDGGLDIFYIDESMDAEVFSMSAVAIPFLRIVEGTWTITWEDQFANIRQWRRDLSKSHEVPVAKELKGSKFASGRGRFRRGNHQLTRAEAATAYRHMLAQLGFLPTLSIITVIGTKAANLYGHSKLEALLYALLQRMRTACAKRNRAGMVFFDEGHGEYTKLYRKARVYLPTGSSQGGWGGGNVSKNLPLDNFTKDGNIKQSQHSFFIQLADVVSFAALLKIRGEQRKLTPWQAQLGLEDLYDHIPVKVLNTRASTADPLGIVRL
jgi:hypothetical protein